MDEAEKYQQRLQAIAEKRRVQEEEDRARRETEEEWLKIAQRKRKSLRDQWLMEPTPSSADASGTWTAPWPTAQRKEDGAEETQSTQMKIKAEDEKPALFMENEPSNLSENNTEEPTQAYPGDEEKKDSATSESVVTFNSGVLLQNGQLERSVLGMLEVQVERDPKTGATTIKSMAPLSAAAVEAAGEAVFDDGRRTVHAVGGVEGSPHSEEELSQILNAITEVGMQTILDGVAQQENQKEKEAVPEVEPTSESADGSPDLTHETLQEEKTPEKEDCGSLAVSKTEKEELRLNERPHIEDKEEVVEERKVTVEEDEWEMVNCRPEEGLDPVVLTFLGFTQVQTGSGLGYEDGGAVLKVEQVIIASEDGSEMGPSKELCPVRVENKSESEEPPKCEKSRSEPGASSASCLEGTPEDTAPEDTSQTVCFVSGAGGSVPLQELSNVSDIIESVENPEDPMEIQQNLPQITSDTTDVPQDAKEVTGYSEAPKKYTEQHGMHAARSGVEAEGLEKTESNLEDEVFQDVPLDGNGETSQTLIRKETVSQSIEKEPEIQAIVPPNITPNRAVGEISTKTKTCQCCTLM